MKYPLVRCETCGRPIAAGPVAGRLSKGRVWRHDPPAARRAPGRPLVSCAGSLQVVDLPVGQMELPEPDEQHADAGAATDPQLF